VLTRQIAFGYTHEDLRLLLGPMAKNGEEPIGSMGTTPALAVLSTARVRSTTTSAALRSGHNPPSIRSAKSW